MRIKSHWFRDGAGKTPAEHASAAAFIVWRVARNMLDRMRRAQFDIDAGPVYFEFLREVLVFLIQVADRIAFHGLPGPAREAFTTALVLRVADILVENEDDLLGPPPPGQAPRRDRFIDLVNEVAGHYAEFGGQAQGHGFEPDFAFRRYLGARIAQLLPDKDRRWALDQVMDLEAPEAARLVERAMQGLFWPQPRAARRAAVSGE